MGATFAALVTGGLTVWTIFPQTRSDPTRFAGDFKAAVSAQAERTRALQDDARDAIGSESSAVFGVYTSMLEVARASLASYEELRAPDELAPKLDAVVRQARAEVRALEHVIEATSSGSTTGITDALRALAEAMANRHGAIQFALAELDDEPDVRTEENES